MTQEEIMQIWRSHLAEQEQKRRELEGTAAAAERAAFQVIKREEAPAVMSYEEIALKAFNLYRLKLALVRGSGRKGKIKTAARKRAIKIIARTPTLAAAENAAAALESLTELTAVIHQAQERERLATFPLAHKQLEVKKKILER